MKFLLPCESGLVEQQKQISLSVSFRSFRSRAGSRRNSICARLAPLLLRPAPLFSVGFAFECFSLCLG